MDEIIKFLETEVKNGEKGLIYHPPEYKVKVKRMLATAKLVHEQFGDQIKELFDDLMSEPRE